MNRRLLTLFAIAFIASSFSQETIYGTLCFEETACDSENINPCPDGT